MTHLTGASKSKKLSQTFMFKTTNYVPYCIILCYTVSLLLLVKYMS